MIAWLLLAAAGALSIVCVLRKLFTSATISENSGFWALALILSMLATAIGLFQYFTT